MPQSERERALLLRLTRDSGRLFAPWRALDIRRFGRVMMHSVLVGAAAGGTACLFFYALEWTEYLLQGLLAGHYPIKPDGEVHVTPHPVGHVMERTWVLPLLTTAGGALCGLLVQLFAPEAGGPGSDAYIEAVHQRSGNIPGRVPVVKMLASLVTIGTGGSAGREGPAMQTCAGLGAVISRWLKLSEQERRILVVAGAAAGTGAIFRTPLGSALYAVEVLYRDDFESDAIVPAIIASVTGYSIFTTVYGPGHLFGTADSYVFNPFALPLYAVMALGVSLFGIAFVSLRDALGKYVFVKLRARLPRWSVPALGGAALGVMALLVPEALGTGYGLVQGAIDGEGWIPDAGGYWLLWGLAAAKMLSTCLTIGSGGSGGEFGPALVVGGLAGGGFGMLFASIIPEAVPQPGAFALVGMGTLFGGIAHTPVSSLIMVCEMTGSYDLLVPLMLAEGVAFLLLRRVRLFRAQVDTKVESPAHRARHTIDVLESIQVKDVYVAGLHLPEVAPDAKLHQVLEKISAAAHPGLAVKDERGELAGLISLDVVQGLISDHEQRMLMDLTVAADVMMAPQIVALDQNLHQVLHAFLVSKMSVLPVIDPAKSNGSGSKFVGLITQEFVTREYERAVAQRLLQREDLRLNGAALDEG